MIVENNEKKNASDTKISNGKINEQNKQNGQQRRADSQKNLLIDLSNDSKPTGNSWVSDKTDERLFDVSLSSTAPITGRLWSAKWYYNSAVFELSLVALHCIDIALLYPCSFRQWVASHQQIQEKRAFLRGKNVFAN